MWTKENEPTASSMQHEEWMQSGISAVVASLRHQEPYLYVMSKHSVGAASLVKIGPSRHTRTEVDREESRESENNIFVNVDLNCEPD